MPLTSDHTICAVVLAAGRGTRLAPVTTVIPKPLAAIGNTTLIDFNLDRAYRHTDRVAVNCWHLCDKLAAHLHNSPVHLARERQLLGTAGAIGNLVSWIGDADVLILNSDAYCLDPLDTLIRNWDHARIRLLVTRDRTRPDFGSQWRFAGASLLPNALARALHATPGGLYEALWAQAEQTGQLEYIPTAFPFIDCGTPPDLLIANALHNQLEGEPV